MTNKEIILLGVIIFLVTWLLAIFWAWIND